MSEISERYEALTGEEEAQTITDLKKLLRDVVLAEGHYSGMEKPRHFAVYALLELAAEVAMPCDRNITEFFITAAHEVDDAFSEDPERFLKY